MDKALLDVIDKILDSYNKKLITLFQMKRQITFLLQKTGEIPKYANSPKPGLIVAKPSRKKSKNA